MMLHTLGGTGGLDVSALCLGVMTFGTAVDEATSFAILDRFTEAGGAFIDTANNYGVWADGRTGDESERLLGRWLTSRRARHRVVLATKAGARAVPAPRPVRAGQRRRTGRPHRPGRARRQPPPPRHRPCRPVLRPHRRPGHP